MKTIAVGVQKGGSGKSTVSVHLAVEAHRRGKSVVLIDVDPQGSVASWARRREIEAPLVLQSTAGQLSDMLKMAEDERVDLVIIDTPPHAGGTIDLAFRIADLVILPVRPGPFDIDAAGATVELLRGSQTRGVFLLTQIPPRGSEADDTAALLGEQYADIQVLSARITNRKAYMTALIEGKAVREFETESSKAVQEIAHLFDELMEKI
jgi:chromosome partitioning protein